jgi:hypothetical protein
VLDDARHAAITANTSKAGKILKSVVHAAK